MSRTMRDFHAPMTSRTYSSVWREGSASGPMGRGPTHANPGFELSLVQRGVLAFDLPRGEVSATTGGCIVLPPQLVNTPRAAGSLHQIMLSPLLVAGAAAELGVAVPAHAQVMAADSRVTTLAALIGRERRRVEDADPLIGALIDALVLALVRPEPAAPAARDVHVRRALEYLAAHLSDTVRIDDVAAHAGLPRFALMHRFKAQVGTSIHQYHQRLRLERAAHALATTTQTILQIALAHGFTDPSRFARAFARVHGATPRAWRARSA